MTKEELLDYVDHERSLGNIPYHVYTTLFDGIDSLEPTPDAISREEVCRYISEFVNHEYSTKEEEELIDNIITGIEHMPSVVPKEERQDKT